MRNPVKGLTEYRYYSCRFRSADTDRDGHKLCTVPHLRADDIDARLWEMMLDWILRPSLLLEKWGVSQRKDVDPTKVESQLNQKRSSLMRAKNRLSRWLDLFGEGDIDKTELKKRSREDKSHVEDLEHEIAALQRELSHSHQKKQNITLSVKATRNWEKEISKSADKLRAALDKLGWRERRTLLENLFGFNAIILGYRSYYSIRAIQSRRHENGEKGKAAADAFMARFCVRPPEKGGTYGLFVRGVLMPVNPGRIMDAFGAVGPKGVFSPKISASV